MDISMDISMDLSMDIHIHGKPGPGAELVGSSAPPTKLKLFVHFHTISGQKLRI